MNTIPLAPAVPGQRLGRRTVTWRPLDLLRHTFAALREWRRRAHGRTALARLDDRMLRDIGLTRADALREIDKPFWRR